MLKFILRKHFESFKTAKLNYGVKIIFSDKSVFSTRENPEITIIFNSWWGELKTILQGSVGFSEGYIQGHIDVLGKDAFRKLLRMFYSLETTAANPPRNIFVSVKRYFLQKKDNNKNYARAKANAHAHYNLPAAFWRIVLGSTLGYTEGYFINGNETLDEAQHNKFDYICRKLYLQPGNKLVEVGTAWGYMAILAAEKYGAEVVNYGLVVGQNEVFEELIRTKHLEAKVKNVVKDHRELINEPNTYDRYVSIGVYEHAGKDCQREWIESIATALKPGGIGFISTSSHMDKFPQEYIFEKYIFPGCYVPSIAEILKLLEEYDLNVVDMESMRPHYYRALDNWYQNFTNNWEKIQAINPKLFNEQFKRKWTVYLAGWSETFEAEHEQFDVFHIVFTKGSNDAYYPLSRKFEYEGAKKSRISAH